MAKHLRSISELGLDGVRRLLELTDHMVEVNQRPNPRVPALRGRTVCNLFFEDSTRTRLSFETAAKRLSADVMTFSVGSSSVNKGESLRDTIETVAAMGIDAFVIRHGSSGVPWQVSRWTTASIVNGGDGWHAHPTQALLDAYTVRGALGRTGGFDGLRVAIVGDIKHSRVARSTSTVFGLLGADVTFVAPATLLPPVTTLPTTDDLDSVIEDVDVLYLLRMQRERTREAVVPSIREYSERFGLTPARAGRLGKHALGAAPRPDEPRRRDPRRSGRDPRRDDHQAGHQRGRRAHGGAVRPPRRAGQRGRAVTRVVLTGGRIVDETGERRGAVVIEGDRIVAVGGDATADGDDVVLDAAGCVVSPGFVDLHAHLREPGREEAETIETGSRAAARGGYTAVVAMPNTEPAADGRGVVELVRAQGERAGLCDVHPSGCITVGRAGGQLAPYAELVDAGVRIFTDDGNGVQDPLLMRRAMEYSRGLDMVLAQHCEVAALTAGAVMHEGQCCSELGVPGWPALAEELMVHRDIELCRLTGARLHLLHLSVARSVELVRRAKAEGLPVTAEAAPHHISLTDEALRGYDPVFKVNPPLRTKADVDALVEGLVDGTIDAIATDHAPHPADQKERPLDEAPPGMVGLETALGVCLPILTAAGMSLVDVVGALSWRPAAIAGLADHGRRIAVGEPANLVVFDPDATWEVVPAQLASRSHNTPYVGRALRGRVRHTILFGSPTVADGVACR